MNVLFLGTPDFACASLEALIRSRHRVVGVVTRPDKPTGRGRKLLPPPVKPLAEAAGIPVLQPAKVNRSEVLDEFAALRPDVVVVVAFGAILREPLLALAPRGAVNVHGSLLPAYRGMAPIQWSLIHGCRTTGVTTMLMDEGVDTGPMLLRREVPVAPGETAGELFDRLAETGGELLVETLDRLEAGDLEPTPQPAQGASYAPRVDKEHGYLDLTRTAREVSDQFRGVTPAPGARVFLGDDAVLVTELQPVADASGAPYTVLETGARHLRVAASEGAVDLLAVRPPGKQTMDAAAFARGRRLEPGTALTPPPVVPDLQLQAVAS